MTTAPIEVRRWPTERPFFILNALVAAGLWLALAASLSSLPYMGVVTAFLFLMHLGLVAQVRGSAVRLGPDQFPELYARVEELARRMRMKVMPEIYLMQQDGALNAFATKCLRSHIVVLFADLLEACGNNDAARDMIIAHELGHIRAGHLWGQWFLLPTQFIPFLGSALSRAREYTCDRYGRAGAGDQDGALLGLTILAAGGKYAPLVSRTALVRQQSNLRSGWMVVGEWLASHPPLAKRLTALAPEIAVGSEQQPRAAVGLFGAALACIFVVGIGSMVLSMWLPGFRRPAPAHVSPPAAIAKRQVEADFERLKALIESDVRNGRPLPWDVWDLYRRWDEKHPEASQPEDPFSGYWYDYQQQGNAYRLLSTGPDGKSRTSDDIVHESRVFLAQ